MINTSTEFKQAMKENNTCVSKAEILLKDGTKLSIGSNVIQGGVKIDDSVCSTGKFEIGNAISNKLCIYLNNIQDDFSEYDFTDATVTVWVGKVLSKTTEWLKKGVFCAQDPTTTPGIITLECLDNMSKFNTVYDGKLIFPATLQDIVRYCCSKCGVILSSEAFPNSKYQVMKNPFRDGGNFTYRVIIQYCAMLAGCFARCNTDGILELKWYDTQAFETGNYAEIKSFSSLSVSTEDVVITGIRVTASDLENEDKTEKGETYLAGAEGYVLSISGNPLVEYGQAKTVASLLAERIVGMRFRPMTASCLGNPSWEAGDALLLTDRKGKTYKSFLTNLTYYTGNYESISCDAEPAARHSADRYTEIEKIIASIKRDTRFRLSEYGKYLDQMNGLAINAMGYYETVEIQDDGSRITYMHDKPSMGDSKIIYKKSIDGYFWSKDGGNTWTGGIDKNGNAVMNVIAAIGLHAEWITSGKLQVSDDEGNIIFLVDMDTKRVIISGDHIRIGKETATDLINTANKNASEALNAAAKARNVTMQLSNDFQAIAVDSEGNYSKFPEHVETSPVVMYGTQEITKECTFQVTKSEYVQGTWDNAKKIYTVTGLTADEGWVDIRATYLTIPVVKRFNLVKQYAGETGEQGADGIGIKGISEKYAISSSNTVEPTTWQDIPPTMTATNRYLWNYEIITFTNNTTTMTKKRVIGVYGDEGQTGGTGKGIKSITNYYLAHANATGVTVSTAGWTTTPQSTTTNKKYLWNYEKITYSDNTTSQTTPCVIGVHGATGATGRTYFLEPSTLVLKRGKDAAISPSFVEFKSFYRDGNKATRTAYAGRFKIEETSDGSTWKTIYTSSANESSVKHSVYSLLTNAVGNALMTATGDGIGIARDIIMIRCTLYAAGGTTNALDTQSVTVVTDADNLTQEEVFDILTNSGASQGVFMEAGQIYVNASYIKSGTFVAGGANNQNGKIEIRNGSNQVIGRWDKDGIYVGSGMIISKNEDSDSEVRVNGGRLNIFSKSKNIGFIGGNYQVNSGYYGLVFDLEVDGSFMTWSIKKSSNDNTYIPVLYYARKEGVLGAVEESVVCGRNLDLLNYELKRANIRDAKISGSFKIPNNTQCDIYSNIDFHNWKLKNVKFEKIAGINGVLPYTGKFYATTATTPQRGATVIIRDGLITAVQEGFH